MGSMTGWLLFAGFSMLGQAAAAPDNLIEDRWEIAYVGSDKIGYFHTEVRRVDASGKPVIHTRQHSQLAIQRFGQQMKMEAITDFFELADGRLYATQSQSRISNEVTKSSGQIAGPGKFKVTVETKGSKVDQLIDWPSGVVGPYSQEKSLHNKPLTAGESRAFLTFMPEMNVVAERRLKAIDKQPVTLLADKKADLLRVSETSDKVALESSLWLDDGGAILKMSLPLAGLDMTTYRTSKEDALLQMKVGDTDIGYQTLVKPDKPIPNAHSASSVTYRLLFNDAPGADTLPESPHQRILSREKNALIVKEQKNQPSSTPNPSAKTVGPEFLESNTYIQPDNAAIQKVAAEVTAGAKTPWEKATRLEKWVAQNMTNQDFSIGFAPSSEIIETRQGDCTEHAVLLAALCRAANIPSRVAMGLVYLESSQSFGYHMWTEVFIDGDWYAIDGTIGQGSIGGGHIKIADGSLKGVDANSTFLPIFKVIGKLKISVEKVSS